MTDRRRHTWRSRLPESPITRSGDSIQSFPPGKSPRPVGYRENFLPSTRYHQPINHLRLYRSLHSNSGENSSPVKMALPEIFKPAKNGTKGELECVRCLHGTGTPRTASLITKSVSVQSVSSGRWTSVSSFSAFSGFVSDTSAGYGSGFRVGSSSGSRFSSRTYSEFLSPFAPPLITLLFLLFLSSP